MKTNISAILTIAIFPLLLASCETTNKPKEDPIPEVMDSLEDVYNSFKACLSENYSEGMIITFKRENKKKDDYTIKERSDYYYFDKEYNDAECNSYVLITQDDILITIELSGYDWDCTNGIEEEGSVAITTYTPSYHTYSCLTQVIHSGDKIYLKDSESGKYVCVLQWRKGVIYLEDDLGHTWDLVD